MAASDPIAGPSRSRPSFSIPHHRSSTPNFRKNVYPPSRSSTPARARSMSTFSYSAREEDQSIRRERAESVRRMIMSWIGLSDKFGHVGLYEDDEVDLRTGRIIVDRGRVAGMEEKKGLGEADSDDEDEDQSREGGEEEDEAVESDEDELGYWDHRSGLDPQVPVRPIEMPWSERDDEDLREFLRMEERRKELAGEEEQDVEEENWSTDEDDEGGSSSHSGSAVDHSSTMSEADESEDELLAFDPEAHRKTPVPSSRNSTPPRSLVSPGFAQIEPPRPAPLSRSAVIAGPSRSTAVQRSKSAPTLRDLFSPDDIPQRASSPSRTLASTLDDLFSPSPPPSSVALPARMTKSQASRPSGTSGTSNADLSIMTYTSESLATASDQFHADISGSSRADISEPSSARPLRRPSRKGKERMISDDLVSPEPSPAHSDQIAPVSPVTSSSKPSRKGKERMTNDDLVLAELSLAHSDQIVPVSPVTSFSSKSGRKGKQRQTRKRSTSHAPMSDTPPEDLDPPSDEERYFQVIHRLNANTVRYCRMCRASSDTLRVERSYFCKGRTNGQNCVFAKDLGEVVVLIRDRNSAMREKRRSMSRALTEGMDKEGGGEEEQVESVLEGPGTPTPKSRRRPRRASAAHMLNPEPEESATDISPAARLEELRARRSLKKALPTAAALREVSPVVDYTSPRTIHEAMLREPTEPDRERWMSEIVQTRPVEMRGMTQSPFTSTDTVSLRNRRESTVLTENGRYRAGSVARSPRVCPLCRQAGGERAEGAITCRGRFWTKHCPFSRANSVGPTPTPVPESRPVDGASKIMSLKRKRPITPTSTSPGADAFDNEGGDHLVSLATRLSLPPSSPPLPSSPEVSQITFGPATPSPAVSAESTKRISPSVSPAYHAPTSPLARRILPLPKGSHYALRPTPPPSLSSRTPSSSGELFLYSRPRSILRAPSERGPSTAPSSLKRARFSLQPSSPTDFSGELFELDNQSIPSSSPWRSETPDHSSSPFSKELSVRAADVGFKLGPVHTGRISAGLMNALYPKTGSASSSSLTPRHVTPQTKASTDSFSSNDTTRSYTLPTPPRSTGSATSTPSRSSRTPSSKSGMAGVGLMLPPPVPPPRMSSTGSSTPGPVTPTRHSPTIAVSPDPPRPVKSSPIKFKVLQPVTHRDRSRSRSRSMSVVPTARPNATPLTKPVERTAATTPKRRRSRTERELARMAREMPDDAGLEWGLDEDVGQEAARAGREGTMFIYVN